jgi:hypothetical protein
MAVRSNRADFDNNVKELKGLTPTDTCNQHYTSTQVYEKCSNCGQFRRREDLENFNDKEM